MSFCCVRQKRRKIPNHLCLLDGKYWLTKSSQSKESEKASTIKTKNRKLAKLHEQTGSNIQNTEKAHTRKKKRPTQKDSTKEQNRSTDQEKERHNDNRNNIKSEDYDTAKSLQESESPEENVEETFLLLETEGGEEEDEAAEQDVRIEKDAVKSVEAVKEEKEEFIVVTEKRNEREPTRTDVQEFTVSDIGDEKMEVEKTEMLEQVSAKRRKKFILSTKERKSMKQVENQGREQKSVGIAEQQTDNSRAENTVEITESLENELNENEGDNTSQGSPVDDNRIELRSETVLEENRDEGGPLPEQEMIMPKSEPEREKTLAEHGWKETTEQEVNGLENNKRSGSWREGTDKVLRKRRREENIYISPRFSPPKKARRRRRRKGICNLSKAQMVTN